MNEQNNSEQQVPQQVPQQSPVTTPSSTPRHSNTLVIVVLVGLVMLGLGLGGGYMLFSNNSKQLPAQTVQQVTQVSPSIVQDNSSVTNTETVNWKTFSSTTYPFSFKYPPELTLLDLEKDTLSMSGSPRRLVSVYADEKYRDYYYPSGIRISVDTTELSKLSIEDYFKRVASQEPHQKKEIMIDGTIPAIEYIQIDDPTYESLWDRLIFKKNDVIYFVEYLRNDGKGKQLDRKTFESILSSIDFTN